MTYAISFMCKGFVTQFASVIVLKRVLSSYVLFQGVTLSKRLLTELASEVFSVLMNGSHVFLEASGLDNLTTCGTIHVLLRYHHFVVYQPHMAIQIGEMCKKLIALRTLKLAPLIIVYNADMLFQTKRSAQNLLAYVTLFLVAQFMNISDMFHQRFFEYNFSTFTAENVVLFLAIVMFYRV